MSSISWIVTTTPQVSGLVEAARGTGLPVEAIVVGDRSIASTVAVSGVDKVTWFDVSGGVPAEAAALAVADLAEEESPSVVLGGNPVAVKAIIGAVAARTGAAFLTDVSSLEDAGGRLGLTRALFGGIADAEEVWEYPVVAVVDAGSAPQGSGEPAPVTAADFDPMALVVAEQRVQSVEHVDLSSAKRIVSVGRGLRSRDDLALINDLAAAVGAEVSCSRPLAEGVDWFPKDRYVGVSGLHISPELYMAVGISGQLQHMSGVKGAHTVVAVNSDKDAPIFEQCDFGVVGDLYEVVPALVDALKG